ncbi:enoyl-CoA hydratase-related protein [Sphingobacterium faecale]|uniref:Enoyl-CoA hydratase/isomerase family protein n=1 Tax=Sphingobacterium faecale TaxID=2803775 RepID=A0ABS1R705_9SPHI|nr:enoyl-CoA hydratase-related protein [Sphingobacterium faecale]MBL1410496.1 enoyl-CoA hydratase/isomerase family protein [Sphingobacterium faecale]
MDTYNTLLVERVGSTAIITINRESKLNALNAETLWDLSRVLGLLIVDTTVRGMILTGAGGKAFVAGADIQEFVGMDGTEAAQLAARGQNGVMDKIANCPKPIIAGINGFALGGGLELALAAHIRIASTNAKLGLPEVSLGLIPGYGGTQRLPQLIGRGRAFEMIMTGDMIGAEEALSYGLVNYVVEETELLKKCLTLLERMYLRSPKALAKVIEAVNTGFLEPKTGFQQEISLFGASFDTDEAKEGIQAFLEKRKPNF